MTDPPPATSAPAAPDSNSRNRPQWATLAILGLAIVGLLAYLVLRPQTISARAALLASMPADAEAVLFLDVNELRRAPFFADLQAWTPPSATDAEYHQFVQETGFHYETDVQRVAVAFEKQSAQQIFFAVADGRFDQRKIKTYAAKVGATHTSHRLDIYSLPATKDRTPISFAFVARNRIAFTNSPNLDALLDAKAFSGPAEWHARYTRLAGSPLFAVIRHDGLHEALAGTAASPNLSTRATGGLTSPQLSALIEQLQWLTIAGKPESNGLRVIGEGESPDEHHSKQLGDLLNGIVLLARAGLSNPRAQQINATTRASYVALLKTVEVTQIDRGDTKSVRLMFFLTADLLKSAQLPPPPVDAPAVQSKPKPTHR